ncbi:MAG: long-chain fatty acid--CoA ligase [Actinomycetota bacterium]|nr:long-chain fatty acid--CoA ligase [Actinomycetota bacterium]
MAHLVTNLIEAARDDGDLPAVKLDNEVLSFRDLLDAASRTAGLLRARGLQPGDRIGLVLPNVPAFPVLFYGSLMAGCVVVPMNPLLKAREIEYCLRDSGAKLVVSSERGGEAAASAAQSVGVEHVPVGPAGPSTDQLGSAPKLDAAVERGDDDNAVLLYSAGMTGKPMGAQLTHANLGSNTNVAVSILGCVRGDVMMGCLPLFHVFGLTCGLNTAVAARACLTLIPRFHPAKALEVIARDGVTIFLGVPTMYSALLQTQNRDSYDLSTLRTCVSGGSAMPVEVLTAFEQTFGCVLLEGYGLSETSPVVTFNHRDAERKPGSIGTPVPGMQVKLVDDQGAETPPGHDQVGEIAIRGGGVMKGYWGRPAETAAAIPDGWFRSGDLATRDNDGYYFIVDRKKDMIIRGGYNVYPRDVEDALCEHESVAEAAVIGLAHPDLGEEVGALVVLEAGANTSVEELQSFVRERVAAYKYPRRMWIVEKLPKDADGNILRRQASPPASAEIPR